MYKEINMGRNLILNAFLLLISFINNKNPKLNLSVEYNKNIIFEINPNMFFKLGQLLMFFYVTNINNKDKAIIRYAKGRLYVEISEADSDGSYINDITAEDIIYKLIDKSTYNNSYFLERLDFKDQINDKNLFDIQNGFELTYKTFIEEKINLISFLNEYESNNFYLNVIKDIKLLSYHDLKIQLKLIKLKFQRKLPKSQLIEKVLSSRYNHHEFIENSKSLLNALTRNAIISFYNNKMELMWFGYIDNELKPIKYMNIYIAIYFAYIAKNTEEKYYLQSAKNAINPLLYNIDNINNSYKGDSSNGYYNILKVLYLLNQYIEYDDLNNTIEINRDLFSIIKLADKLKNDSEVENLILKFIYDDGLNLLKSLILS